MRARTVVVSVVVIAGLGVAAYGIVPLVASAIVPTTTTTTALPPGTPVGFNAARTEFVLPHNLGLLPGPELTLAKADPAYASGLGNAHNWVGYGAQEPSKSNSGPNVMLWEYVGTTLAQSAQVNVMYTKGDAWDFYWMTVENDGNSRVAPSPLEVLAAPVGMISVKGVQRTAFCVPMPSSVGYMTSAGPSTAFLSAANNNADAKGVASCNNFH